MAGGWRRGWAVRASGRRILDAGWTRGSGSAAQGLSSGRACRAGGARTQSEWRAVRVGTRNSPYWKRPREDRQAGRERPGWAAPAHTAAGLPAHPVPPGAAAPTAEARRGPLPRAAERVLLVIADDVTWLDKADAAVVGFVVRRVTDAPMSSTTLPDSAAAGKLPVGSRRDAHHDPVTGAGRLLGCRSAGSSVELGQRLCQGVGTAGFEQVVGRPRSRAGRGS